MEHILKNGQQVNFREYQESDFPDIQQLNSKEGWNNLVQKDEETKMAWQNSNVSIVMTAEMELIGYVRGLTDEAVTLFVCELLIKEEYRGLGAGQELLSYLHRFYPSTRMELLTSSSSKTYYEKLNFRAFYGFRKTIDE